MLLVAEYINRAFAESEVKGVTVEFKPDGVVETGSGVIVSLRGDVHDDPSFLLLFTDSNGL